MLVCLAAPVARTGGGRLPRRSPRPTRLRADRSPEPVAAYNIFQLTGDVVGLVQALGEEQAVIVGHDVGAPVAWHCALLRPDLFRALVLLSVCYAARSWQDRQPTAAMKQMAGDQEYYQLYFQEPGKAELELEADVGKTLRMLLYSIQVMHHQSSAGAFCSTNPNDCWTRAPSPTPFRPG